MNSVPLLSLILCMVISSKVQTKEWNPDEAPIQQVVSNHFMTTPISHECTVEEFQRRNDLRLKGANVFIEYGDQVVNDIRDVILKHKVMIRINMPIIMFYCTKSVHNL